MFSSAVDSFEEVALRICHVGILANRLFPVNQLPLVPIGPFLIRNLPDGVLNVDLKLFTEFRVQQRHAVLRHSAQHQFRVLGVSTEVDIPLTAHYPVLFNRRAQATQLRRQMCAWEKH